MLPSADALPSTDGDDLATILSTVTLPLDSLLRGDVGPLLAMRSLLK